MNRIAVLALASGLVVAVLPGEAGAEDFCTESDYRVVRVEKGALVPFAGQHELRIQTGAFRDPHGRDFVAEGVRRLFGGKKLLHRFLRMENGVPVYSPGEPFPKGPSPQDNDERRGRFDVDGDGIEDLLTANWSYRGAEKGFPWAGGEPWQDTPSPYSGIGKGYDIMGRWHGFEAIGEVYWSKGAKGADGKVTFGPRKNVLLETPGFERLKGLRRILTWKMFHGITAVCVLKTKAGRWLVLQGDVDALVALPLSFRDGEAYCGAARPLLKSGLRMTHGYLTHGLYPVDLDLDGQDELLCDGNPSVVVCFKGDEPGNFTSTPVLLEGGDVCVETLAAPTRYDWDGDGRPDLILSDSTGWLTFWGGTDDPIVYKAPRPFTRDGKPWLVPAGENGSMQGIWERCWGYVKPTAGTWRGKNVILTTDVRGDMFLRIPTEDDAFELRDAQFREPNGEPYKVAWRCKADFVRAKTGFANVPWDSFLVQDLDGDAAVAIPQKEWSLTIDRTVKLTYADGKPIRLCGINGLWGRGHFALVDWDGDGDLDFLFGSDRACTRFFRPDLQNARAAQPYLFRNVGTNAKPVFARGEPLRLKKNGKRLNFVSHNATSSVSDWTGDGKPDLMVGAENGKVYAFEHDELFVEGERSVWEGSEWISVPSAPTFDGVVRSGCRAADGTSWFATTFTNEAEVASARWRVTGLGVFDVFVNGRSVGTDFLKPGFTHVAKTKYAFEYDVTGLIRRGRGAANALAAEVSAGWWRDKVVSPNGKRGFAGRKSAFRGVLELTYADGSRRVIPSNVRDWTCGTAGPVKRASIFDGEEYDARVASPRFGDGLAEKPERNDEFKGEILPSPGAEIVLREDLMLKPVRTYAWKGIAKATSDAWGTVDNVREIPSDRPFTLRRGETLVVDFGQNAAAVPSFVFSARGGVMLTALPAEMLNDRNGDRKRGNDGPEGSIYRANLQNIPIDGARVVYTFAGTGRETYRPRFTYFGYRYLSVTATDDVMVESVASVPVSSVKREMESGTIETGNADLNRFIANVRWGQLSNYLSVPTDCPQRGERLGWTADTQVFAETGSFLADTRRFFRKWMRDMRDSVNEHGSFPGVAPTAQFGEDMMRLGWADAGVIVPWRVWRQYGERSIIDDNWAAMAKFVDHVAETRYRHEAIVSECLDSQWADWLSYEDYETWSGRGFLNNDRKSGKVRPETYDYWDYLGGCYWLYDAQLMRDMAAATGRDAAKYEAMAAEAKAYLKKRFFAADDGLVLPTFRHMQTPAVFALRFGLVEGDAKAKTLAGLVRNIADHGDCLQTGFLGTSFLMDVLSENGAADVAYTLLLQHKNPSWLYSVDQGATTVWERWNSYTIDRGFGPVAMNSFNHYAYGAVLAWVFRTAAGIACDPDVPGFRRIVMRPVPDRRLGHVTAAYDSAVGRIESAWKYEGDAWTWEFTVPKGAVASVTVPGETAAREYGPGRHRISKTGLSNKGGIR